jgi:hypothetical protein
VEENDGRVGSKDSACSGVLEKLKGDACAMLQNHQDADGIRFTRSVFFAFGTK